MTSTRSDAEKPEFDIFVIGGGINGAGIAREATRRGYSVFLCDSGDFGSGTSSASTKLIHGGLRYLEHYEFKLVRESLMEREVLWKMAPHIIRPMRFVLPHHKGLRPAWLLRLGLFLYDHLGGRKLLPATKTLDLGQDAAGIPLKKSFKNAFEYSDCWVEDSRLVILNLRVAQKLGAEIIPRTPVRKAVYKKNHWHLKLGDSRTVTASVVVNATGPWVDQVLGTVFNISDSRNVRLVRGSHIVINQKFKHDRAYIFQNSDERIIFAIPYEGDFTLIGTTDTEHSDIAKKPEITQSEISYLCKMASEYFEEPVTQNDIVWTYSGVRPLYDDGASKAQEATRDYVIRAESTVGNDSLINIFGGKITTFRKLARSLVDELEKRFPGSGRDVIPEEPFPGGNFPISHFDQLVEQIRNDFPFMERDIVTRMVRTYGTEVRTILNKCETIDDLGQYFGSGLYQREVEFLKNHEWARTAEDILYRRTKLGLHMKEDEIVALEDWINQHQ
ncbi:MAG: glycerol-3-phosphate dehydrogenase [Rhizobiaceae bacterium]